MYFKNRSVQIIELDVKNEHRFSIATKSYHITQFQIWFDSISLNSTKWQKFLHVFEYANSNKFSWRILCAFYYLHAVFMLTHLLILLYLIVHNYLLPIDEQKTSTKYEIYREFIRRGSDKMRKLKPVKPYGFRNDMRANKWIQANQSTFAVTLLQRAQTWFACF